MSIDTQKTRIHKLSPQLANQIAAGEVIERPASVLKELLENSLDAGSTQIEINFEHGGLSLIRVQDNGCGICKEDLALALSQHATSKIHSLTDLESVTSLGFRGEALASISAVSRLSLTSWVPEQELGWTIRTEGREGNIVLQPAPRLSGTLIEIRDLFYNTPARRKFLRSEKTESIHFEEVFKSIALSQPKITFTLKQGDKLLKRLPACHNQTMESNRVGVLCGQHFIKNASSFEAESNGLKLWGWLGSPETFRAQSDLQYFYLNGRRVRDKLVNHAVRQAYQSLCPPGRYPAFLLFFTIDPENVDVNVHPTKHEVRFREARSVSAFLTYSIREGLTQICPVPVEAMATQEAADFEQWSRRSKSGPTVGYQSAALSSPLDARSVTSASLQVNTHTPESLPESLFDFGKPLSLVNNEFLLAESKNELIMVDIKELRRFIVRSTLLQAYSAGSQQTKTLMMPKSFVMVPNHAPLIEQKGNNDSISWSRLGFEISEIGSNHYVLRKVPAVFKNTNDIEAILPMLFSNALLENAIDSIAEIILNQPLQLQEAAVFLSTVDLENPPFQSFRQKITAHKLRKTFF